MITQPLIAALAPRCNAALTAAALAAGAAEFGIADPVETAMWLGQVMVESQNFTRLEENLIYSAQRLVAVWPNRFPDVIAATPYAFSPQRLAEKVYGGRADLGNNEQGDGWRFRGRGYLQTTGRANYGLTSAGLDLDLVTDPDRLSVPLIAGRAAAFYWSHHDLGPLARAGDIAGVTRAINGGLTGLADRQAAFTRARDLIGALAA